MPARKLIGALLAGALVAAVLRRASNRRRQRVDVYFQDGSMISLTSSRPEGRRLLSLAREILAAARA